MYIMLLTMVEYTTLTLLSWVYCTYHLGKTGRKKKTIARRLSLGRRLREHIQHFFFLYLFSNLSAMYADLVQPEMRVLCELVGTLNVWMPINTPINQSTIVFTTHFLPNWHLLYSNIIVGCIEVSSKQIMLSIGWFPCIYTILQQFFPIFLC